MIDLKQFCEPDDWRVCEPWRAGDSVYATDKKIIIRVLVSDYPDVRPRMEAPKIEDMGGGGVHCNWNHWMLNNWQEIPSELPEVTECAECKGVGEHTCTCGSEHECGKCEGRGETKKIIRVTIGSAEFDPKLLRKIAALPMARIQAATSDKEPVAFCFTGGLGYVMPMKKEESK